MAGEGRGRLDPARETTAQRRAVMYSSAAVTPQSFEFIEYLLWMMEQIDSPEAKLRRRWWVYRSKVEYPKDNESIEYSVSFVRVQCQPEPQEYSFSHHKRRLDGAMSLPRCSPRFPRHSPRFNSGGASVAVGMDGGCPKVKRTPATWLPRSRARWPKQACQEDAEAKEGSKSTSWSGRGY